jgi:hypothetical protein
MSEYIDIETELSENGAAIFFTTNLPLTDAGIEETYGSAEAMEEGSPVAQTLASVDGIARAQLNGGEMVVHLLADADWHAVVADVSAALKDFFL